MTYLNNTYEWFYESPHNKLEENFPNWFGAKLCPIFHNS